jgi:hypothetical protein
MLFKILSLHRRVQLDQNVKLVLDQLLHDSREITTQVLMEALEEQGNSPKLCRCDLQSVRSELLLCYTAQGFRITN